MKIGLSSWVCLLGLVTRAFAAPPCDDTGSCLRVVEEGQESTRVMAARFRQTKHVSLLAEPIVTEGRFAFRRPDEMLWRISEPALTIRMKGGELDLPEEMQDRKGEVRAALSAMRHVSSLLSGSFESVGDLFAVEATAEADAVAVRLQPRQSALRELFEAIEVRFATPHYTVSSVEIEEALGDRLEIVFLDVHRNDAEAEAVFAEP